MIWLFERADEAFSVETEYDAVSGEYLVTLRQPDGATIVERFPNTETLEARLVALEQNLEADRWRRGAVRLKDSFHI
jgi:hypothetical protein